MNLTKEKPSTATPSLIRPSSQHIHSDRSTIDGLVRRMHNREKRESLLITKLSHKLVAKTPRHGESIVLPTRVGAHAPPAFVNEKIDARVRDPVFKKNSIFSEKKISLEGETNPTQPLLTKDHRRLNSNLALQNLKGNPNLLDRQKLTFGKATLKVKDCGQRTTLFVGRQLNFESKAQDSKQLTSSGPLNGPKPSKPSSAILNCFTMNKPLHQRPRNVLSDNEDMKPSTNDKQAKSICEDLSSQSSNKNTLRKFFSSRFQAQDCNSTDERPQLTFEDNRRKSDISRSLRSIDSETQIRSILKTSASISAEKKHVKIDESRNVLHMIEGRLKPDDFQAVLRKNLDFNVPNLYNMFLNNSLSETNDRD
jgi:hypothetical protein